MYVYSVFLQVILLFNCLKTIKQRINSQVIWLNQCKLVFFNASIPEVRGLIHEYMCVCAWTCLLTALMGNMFFLIVPGIIIYQIRRP